jgi:hypothetical protein
MLSTDTLRLDIEAGGHLKLVPPVTDEERCRVFSMALGASMLFGAGVVKLAHWLPGLHLYVQVARETVRRQTLSETSFWPAVDAVLQRWIAQPASADTLTLRSEWGQFVIVSEGAHWSGCEVVFTMSCVWPGALVGLASS